MCIERVLFQKITFTLTKQVAEKEKKEETKKNLVRATQTAQQRDQSVLTANSTTTKRAGPRILRIKGKEDQ